MRLLRFLVPVCVALAGRAGAAPVQNPAPATTASPGADLQAAIRKSNAYVKLMNRTLRASESWSRYTSWVKNEAAGPSGKERIVYGLYSLYDVRSEIEKALAETIATPAYPELDATVERYVDAYNAFAPIVTEAAAYYERKDYFEDKWAGARALHARLAPAATVFLAERAKLEVQMKQLKQELDRTELAEIEKREGRKANWQVRNVMIEAGRIVDLLPSGAKPVVELPRFDDALSGLSSAVKEFDAYAAANPGSFHVFESSPHSYLGKLREFRQKLGRVNGDARRADVSNDLTWLINDYNMMVSTSVNATMFAK